MPTRKGLILITVVLICYLGTTILNIPAFLYFAGILLALLGLDFLWLRLTCFGVTCNLKITSPVAVGENTRLRFTVRNRWPLPRYGITVWLPFPASPPPVRKASLLIASLPGGATTQHRLDELCDRRGNFQIDHVNVLYRGPLGLFQQNRKHQSDVDFEVHPPCVRLDDFPLFRAGKGFTPTDQHESKPGSGMEFYSVRPYTSGDSPRFVHWLSTLRARQLMTRQFESMAQRQIILILDCLTGYFSSTKKKQDFETAVTTVASIAKTAYHTDHSVGLLSFGLDQQWVEPAPGVENLRRILSSLSKAEQKVGDPPEEELRKLSMHSASLVFVTSAPDIVSARLLTHIGLYNRELRVITINSSDAHFTGKAKKAIDIYRNADVRIDHAYSEESLQRDLGQNSSLANFTCDSHHLGLPGQLIHD